MYVEIAVLAHLLPFVIIFIFLLSQGQTRQRGGFVLSLHVYSDEFKEPLRGKSKLFGFNGQLHLVHPPSRRGSLRQFPAEEDDSPGQRGGNSRRAPRQNIWDGVFAPVTPVSCFEVNLRSFLHFPSSDDTLKPGPDTGRWLEAQQGHSTRSKVLSLFHESVFRSTFRRERGLKLPNISWSLSL